MYTTTTTDDTTTTVTSVDGLVGKTQRWYAGSFRLLLLTTTNTDTATTTTNTLLQLQQRQLLMPPLGLSNKAVYTGHCSSSIISSCRCVHVVVY